MQLVKSYLELCSPLEFEQTIRLHSSQLIPLSLHVYACRIVQQMVSMANTSVSCLLAIDAVG